VVVLMLQVESLVPLWHWTSEVLEGCRRLLHMALLRGEQGIAFTLFVMQRLQRFGEHEWEGLRLLYAWPGTSL